MLNSEVRWLCPSGDYLRDVAQFGRALRSGRRGHRFKSCHPDHFSPTDKRSPICFLASARQRDACCGQPNKSVATTITTMSVPNTCFTHSWKNTTGPLTTHCELPTFPSRQFMRTSSAYSEPARVEHGKVFCSHHACERSSSLLKCAPSDETSNRSICSNRFATKAAAWRRKFSNVTLPAPRGNAS